jgi:hypothetical protein
MPSLSKKRLTLSLGIALMAAMFSTSRNAAWALNSITSNNSTLTFNTSDPANPYITNWVVDGTDQFGGTPAGGDTLSYFNGSAFAPINGLTLEGTPTFTANVANVTYAVTYEGFTFTINVQNILSGGSTGSGASGVTETITVTNVGETAGVNQPAAVGPVTFTIQDQVDANLNATPNDDTLTLGPSGTVNQAVQTDPAGVKLTYTTTPVPNQYFLVNGGTPTVALGPETGNEAFIFDWDLSLSPGDTGIISITEALSGAATSVPGVPLPSSAASAMVGLAGLGAIGLIQRKRHPAI